MRRDRGEHERVGIDSTTCRTTLICWWMQRGMRGVEGGEDTPPTEAAAGRQRTRGHDRTSAHKVNPDVPPIRFGTGVIKDGDGRCGGPVSVAQIHHEVADNASPGIEQMQLRLAPVQQPRRGGLVKISSRRDDDRDDRIGGGHRRHTRNTGVGGGQVNAHAVTVRGPRPRRQGRSALSCPLLRLCSPCGAGPVRPAVAGSAGVPTTTQRAASRQAADRQSNTIPARPDLGDAQVPPPPARRRRAGDRARAAPLTSRTPSCRASLRSHGPGPGHDHLLDPERPVRRFRPGSGSSRCRRPGSSRSPACRPGRPRHWSGCGPPAPAR